MADSLPEQLSGLLSSPAVTSIKKRLQGQKRDGSITMHLDVMPIREGVVASQTYIGASRTGYTPFPIVTGLQSRALRRVRNHLRRASLTPRTLGLEDGSQIEKVIRCV
jgi:hypothetical protein